VKTFIRNRDFFKLPQALETSAEFGMWSFERYQTWMAKRSQWHVPNPDDEAPDQEENGVVGAVPTSATQVAPAAPTHPTPSAGAKSAGPFEIEPVAGGLECTVPARSAIALMTRLRWSRSSP
jgi:hypothetical protein